MAWLSPFPIPSRRRAVSPIVTAGEGGDGGHLNHKDRLFLAALEFLPLPLLPLALHRKNHPLSLSSSPLPPPRRRIVPTRLPSRRRKHPPLPSRPNCPALPGKISNRLSSSLKSLQWPPPQTECPISPSPNPSWVLPYISNLLLVPRS